MSVMRVGGVVGSWLGMVGVWGTVLMLGVCDE